VEWLVGLLKHAVIKKERRESNGSADSRGAGPAGRNIIAAATTAGVGGDSGPLRRR